MFEDITEEEYKEALINFNKAKEDMFNIRYSMATTKDNEKLIKLESDLKTAKENFRLNNRKIHLYEMYKRGRVYK